MTLRSTAPKFRFAIAVVALFAATGLVGVPASAALVSSTTTLKVVPTKQTVGNPITLTATISSGTLPTGTVEFFEGAASLGTAPVVSRVAQLSSNFALGSHTVTAAYSGDLSVSSSTSNAVTAFVGDPSNTKTVLQPHSVPASPIPTWTATTPVRLVANVGVKAGFVSYGARTGTVTIRVDGVPFEVIVARNRVVFDIPGGLGLGEHVLVATYHGDIHYNASTSRARHVTVINP